MRMIVRIKRIDRLRAQLLIQIRHILPVIHERGAGVAGDVARVVCEAVRRVDEAASLPGVVRRGAGD